jgi:hypothetical protein
VDDVVLAVQKKKKKVRRRKCCSDKVSRRDVNGIKISICIVKATVQLR